MGVTPGPLYVTAYREGRSVTWAWSNGTDLAPGTYLYDIAYLQAGERLNYLSLLAEVACVNGGGTAVASVIFKSDSLAVLGSTVIDLTATSFKDFFTAAGSGGPASVVTCRRAAAAGSISSVIVDTLQLKVVIATATATVAGSGTINAEFATTNLLGNP